MTKRQKRFINFSNDEVQPFEEEEEEFASIVEKFCTVGFAPSLLSKVGRVAVLIIWAIWAGVEIYGIYRMRTDFSIEFFLPQDTATYDYF